MVTIELAKPKGMEYGMPDCDDCGPEVNLNVTYQMKIEF
jgi:hypothetical protein